MKAAGLAVLLFLGACASAPEPDVPFPPHVLALKSAFTQKSAPHIVEFRDMPGGDVLAIPKKEHSLIMREYINQLAAFGNNVAGPSVAVVSAAVSAAALRGAWPAPSAATATTIGCRGPSRPARRCRPAPAARHRTLSRCAGRTGRRPRWR